VSYVYVQCIAASYTSLLSSD